MSLTSLFNFNYMKENIKKSKAIILLCLLLPPIINFIILLMNCSNDYNYMPSTFEASSVILLGMYVVPVILSITLFSFVYKKGSTLFTLSMPISKKQISATNTLCGIVIIILMNFINLILSLIISVIYSNFIVAGRMLFDIFLIYSIAYIFVFTSCNIAVSLSSNKITTVVLLLLILFLVPFVNTFISSNGFTNTYGGTARIECKDKACTPVTYECSSTKCEIDKSNNIYSAYVTKIDNTTYTLPYQLIKDCLFDMDMDINTNINTSLLKMGFLSIIYIFIGYALFIRKKFEVVGTSFKSDNVHILVRSLTTIPIACIAYVIFDNSYNSYDFFSIILMLVLIFAYLIIYDLITRKKVTNIFKMLICLTIVFGIVCFTGMFFDTEEYRFDVNDIRSMSILDNNKVSIGSTSNKEATKYVMSLLLDSTPRGNITGYYSILISCSDGDYYFNISVTDDDYEVLKNILINDKEFTSSNKLYREANVFGIGYLDGYTDSDSTLSKKIIEYYRKNGFNYNYNDYDTDLFDVNLYVYDNYRVRSMVIYVKDELANELSTYYNNNVKDYLSNNEQWDYSYYVNDKYYGSYEEIGKFIANNYNDVVDTSQEYNYIRVYGLNSRYVFITNKVDELNDVLKGYNNNIGDTYEEYID